MIVLFRDNQDIFVFHKSALYTSLTDIPLLCSCSCYVQWQKGFYTYTEMPDQILRKLSLVHKYTLRNLWSTCRIYCRHCRWRILLSWTGYNDLTLPYYWIRLVRFISSHLLTQHPELPLCLIINLPWFPLFKHRLGEMQSSAGPQTCLSQKSWAPR